MHVRTVTVRDRRMWELDNGALALRIAQGGGHLASLTLSQGPSVNPFWVPVWKGLEPWEYRPEMKARYGCKLLAAILGHNPCLGAFGEPSAEEARAGLENHGEAPNVRWRVLRKRITPRGLTFECGCDLPIARMRFVRQISMPAGSRLIRVRSRITSLARQDMPYTMCEHVTFGPPFLEKGVTLFDMPATKGHTFPGPFSKRQRLKPDTAFVWPKGPGPKGAVDLRTIGTSPARSGDFSAQLIDPRRSEAWFSAVNPALGLGIAYVWNRSDFPWVGNWEENGSRAEAPWAGRSLTRGMEFTNTPFAIGLRRAVSMGSFQGQPTYRWLPARATVETEFSIMAFEVDRTFTGVRNIRPSGAGFVVELA